MNQGIPPIHTQEPLHRASTREQIAGNFPGVSAGDFLQVVIISGVFLVLGYLLAYFSGTKLLLALTAQYIGAGTAELASSTTLDPYIQLICGLPCALFSLVPVVAVILLLLSRFGESHQVTLKIAAALASFILGLVIFVPVQILLVLGAVI